ncbi:MAG: adenylate kinase [Nanoarchaeota archaeon]|nr:adenylate kinase [DPANN group archaeon]MBL7116285.1 adenylate kinase [Nanoarchaeota archaeon]
MRLIIFGQQASGKGTQAEKITEHYGIPHISTGDIFRENISKGTELGKLAKEILDRGELVPDEITNKIIEERLSRDDCSKGFILDGYPRNRNQAEFLDNLPYQIDAVINLEVSQQELIKRISSRRVCVNCKTNYNLIYIKPKQEGMCNKCGGKLIIRDDDKPEAIKKRLAIYHEQTEPLLKFYEEKGILKNINGEQPMEAVSNDIIKALEE